MNQENPSSGTSRLQQPGTYRGRFAPTPSGPLHFGSIIAALGSYLQAKSQSGKWLLRIEDIDTVRNEPGAADIILRTLDNFGLHWDEDVIVQTQRIDFYQDLLDVLIQQGLIYPCICSRADTKGMPYPGTCRHGHKTTERLPALRLRTNSQEITVADQLQGPFRQNLGTEIGDFILRRSDGIIAYHLAVVADDHAQGITEIVRGCDLLDSTPRQVYLQRLLNYQTPAYCHLPVAANADGSKISKQNHAAAVNSREHAEILFKALEFLGQSPEQPLQEATPEEILHWGIQHWDLGRVPRLPSITANI